ncbi:VQ motif-containing protein 4 [Lactuca sativa]|uniref:VQ motif-containing protein 4 n=1 Tax=Lactuca sativa TaxID=4236 RepID=UPI0022AF38B9|nr:VQ motif-containing protein 4 [Lactuca sativa]
MNEKPSPLLSSIYRNKIRSSNQIKMENYLASTSGSTNTINHPSPPTTPVTISNPNNPYPTSFVQADTTSFKKVVQMLTGSFETVKQSTTTTRPDLAVRNLIPAMKMGPNKKPSKLYERQSSLKNFKINPLAPGFTNDRGFSGSPWNPNAPEIMSPSLLDFPSLVLSLVTPLLSDPFNRSSANDCCPNLDVEAEEKAVAEKGFYLHPSPTTTRRREELSSRVAGFGGFGGRCGALVAVGWASTSFYLHPPLSRLVQVMTMRSSNRNERTKGENIKNCHRKRNWRGLSVIGISNSDDGRVLAATLGQ